jgi:hypothetical protein
MKRDTMLSLVLWAVMIAGFGLSVFASKVRATQWHSKTK